MPANESGGSQASEAPEHASELSAIIVSELRDTYGIKYRKEKKSKPAHDKTHRRKIFNVALDKLELTDVILANGGITQVPLFVSDACQRILEQVHTEGLFRKAGSTARQREIRAHLEAGTRLGQSHHVIDVANVLKLFFRELPEPLLAPGSGQEAILRCLLCGDRRVHALLLSVLLLPTLALNTLTFFMQFLFTVSQHAAQNRMTSENLAIIFAPGLMPLPEIVPQRLESHCRVIRMLIEQSADIGTVPRYILDRVQRRVAAAQQAANAVAATTTGRGRSKSLAAVCEEPAAMPETEKKKKKRRSGMFNGLRKIVGSAIGSTDELDTTPEHNPATPCLTKTAKKRKVLDTGGFSAKKKKDVLALLPENGAMLPSTPMCTKNPKKSRLSLGGRRNDKKTTASTTFLPDDQPAQPPMERRWSVVGAPWSRKKTTTTSTTSTTRTSRLDDIFGSRKSMAAAVRSSFGSRDASPLPAQRPRADSMDGDTYVSSHYLDDLRIGDGAPESDFMRISKSEYEAIKERVSAIETRISQEFGAVVNASRQPPGPDDSLMSVDDDQRTADGPAAVLSKYERTLEQTEATNAAAVVAESPATDQLAKRLSRELKIRRSVEHSAAVIRSPSARKIGTMRRRSRESAVRLSRNFSWHIGNSSTAASSGSAPLPAAVAQHRPVAITMPQSSDECDAAAAAVAAASTAAAAAAAAAAGQQVRANLKRGRPNTVQTGLRHPSPTKKCGAMAMPMQMDATVAAEATVGGDGTMDPEQWTSGEKFFAVSGTPQSMQKQSQPQTPVVQVPKPTNQENHPQTPYFVSTLALNEMKTPMLPPRRPLNFRTPLTLHNAAIVGSSSATKTPMLPPRSTQKLSQQTPAAAATAMVVNRALATPMSAEGLTGRASIARLRSQNAGHVAAKARLFNAFVSETDTGVAAATVGVVSAAATTAIGPASSATSIAAAVVPILQHGHQRRQSAAFALKNMRQMHTGNNTASTSGRPSIAGAPNVQKMRGSGTTAHGVSSPRKSATPSGVASRRSAAKNHLNGIHRRQKLRLARSPIKRSSPMRLKHLIDGAADTVQASPSGGRRQRTPKAKATFHTAMDSIVNGSPRCVGNRSNGGGGGGGQTPVKVLRHSPRLQTRAGGGALMY